MGALLRLQLVPGSQLALLDHSLQLHQLYNRLGVEVLDAGGLLAAVLLPYFAQLRPEAQQRMLQYVLAEWRQLCSEERVVDALKSTAFVDAGSPSSLTTF